MYVFTTLSPVLLTVSPMPSADTTHIILAMPHRGRLNLLAGLLGYDPAALFHKIKGGAEVEVEDEVVSGDVLSHLGGFIMREGEFRS